MEGGGACIGGTSRGGVGGGGAILLFGECAFILLLAFLSQKLKVEAEPFVFLSLPNPTASHPLLFPSSSLLSSRPHAQLFLLSVLPFPILPSPSFLPPLLPSILLLLPAGQDWHFSNSRGRGGICNRPRAMLSKKGGWVGVAWQTQVCVCVCVAGDNEHVTGTPTRHPTTPPCGVSHLKVSPLVTEPSG